RMTGRMSTERCGKQIHHGNCRQKSCPVYNLADGCKLRKHSAQNAILAARASKQKRPESRSEIDYGSGTANGDAAFARMPTKTRPCKRKCPAAPGRHWQSQWHPNWSRPASFDRNGFAKCCNQS